MKLRKIFFIGNAHIDPVWLWDWREGVSEVLVTFSDAKNMLKKHKDLCFTASSTIFYEWVEKIDRNLFRELKDIIARDRWEIAGGWIIEPDCNIPFGESFVRHSLYGQQYYYSRFGKKTVVGYNIDSFGHNWNIPQILSKSGIKYYVFMRPGPHEKELPSPIFWWEAPDGSRVLAYRIPYSYCNAGESIRERVKKLIKEYGEVSEVLLFFYGKGDHGGGPNDEDLKIIGELDGFKGVKMIFSTLEEAFREIEVLEKEGTLKIPTVRDELQYHAVGCYSVVHLVKKLNRMAEHYLLAAERIATIAYLTANFKYSSEDIREAWKKVLFNQFHDILAGTSIKKAYEEDVSRRFYSAIQEADDIITFSVKSIEKNIRIRGNGSFFILWNLNTFPIKFPVEYEAYLTGLKSKENIILKELDGKTIPFEKLPKMSKTGARRVNIKFIAELPALGYKVYNIVEGGSSLKSYEPIKKYVDAIENDFYEIKKEGDIGFSRIIHKKSRVTPFKKNVFSLLVLDDNTDTWTHETNEYPDSGEYISFKDWYVEESAIEKRVICKGNYNRSKINLVLSIYNDLPIIDIKIVVDWHEQHKLLKLIIPFNVISPKITVEIPYGSIVRNEEYVERPMQRWIDVTGTINEMKIGATIINDGIYSYDFRNNNLRLTLLRSPLYAHHIPYKLGKHREEEYTDQGLHYYRFIIFIHEGELDKKRAVRMASILNTPIIGVLAFPNDGYLSYSQGFLDIEPDNVHIEVLKKSEKDNDIIIRMYEVEGKGTKGLFKILGREYLFDINANEIKTFKINVATGRMREVNLLEE